jgi:hypothetical protein
LTRGRAKTLQETLEAFGFTGSGKYLVRRGTRWSFDAAVDHCTRHLEAAKARGAAPKSARARKAPPRVTVEGRPPYTRHRGARSRLWAWRAIVPKRMRDTKQFPRP